MNSCNLKILSIEETCTGCGACVSICPKGALGLSYNKEGFYYPHLNSDLCISCHSCERVCHVINRQVIDTPNRDYIPYMLQAKSDDLKKKSSSGGAFSLLADYVLNQGGNVYGARYNYETERLECSSTDECDISELRKSKYIESYLGDTFKKIKLDLKSGRKVLFCGTPCQVSGLSSYLNLQKIPTDNLLLVRFICHGVPSNKFFTEYKHYIEKKIGSKITLVDFRPKTNGWKSMSILMKFDNNKVIDEPYINNYYYSFFEKSYCLRSSCYTCKEIYRNIGDITLADFWGINKYKPENQDQKGISLALLNSRKGQYYFDLIKAKCVYEQLPLTAVDYIYKNSDVRKNQFQDALRIKNKVVHEGYMNVAFKLLGKQIFFNKSRDQIKRVLKQLGIWQMIKK